MVESAARAVLIALLAAAAVVDVRERRLPNALALALAVAAAVCALGAGGSVRLLAHVGAAAALVVLLAGIELVWRRCRGRAGQGMGDVKLVGALALADPVAALGSYALGLAALAVCCLAARRPSLPLIPFIAPIFAIWLLVG